MLAEALCKLEGFDYAPSDTHWWQMGRSTERDFLCASTRELSRAELQQLSEAVGPERTLLVLCLAFQPGEWPNLTVKKIPLHVLDRCEWGKDDYSLEISNLPWAPREPEQMSLDFSGKGGSDA